MGKYTEIALVIGAALFVSFGGVGCAQGPQFIVDGEVYCEVCRTNFINRLSEPMAGATVRLECRGEDPKNITYKLEGTTDAKGVYSLTVEGDHGEEACGVTLVKSSRPDCDIIPNEGWAIEPTAIITVTKNSGFHDNKRHANPLGFTKKNADPGCAKLFEELAVSPSDDDGF